MSSPDPIATRNVRPPDGATTTSAAEAPAKSIFRRFVVEVCDLAGATRRFPIPEDEAAYVAFSQASLLYHSFATLGSAGLAFFVNSIANVNPEPRPLVYLFCALTVVIGAFGIICHCCKNRFNTPFHSELQWVTAAMCWILCETSVVDTRPLIFCLDTLYTPPPDPTFVPNMNVTVSPGIPSNPHYQECLKVYIDCPQLFNPSVLFLFRFIWAAPITLLILLICLHSFRYSYERVVFHRRDIFMYWWLCGLCFVFSIRERKRRRAFRIYQGALASMEQAQNAQVSLKALLANVLAPSIVDRMLRQETIYDQQRATVLYSDMAGFTQWSSKRPAPQVAQMLNEMFRHHDANLTKFGIEKITTIGDAYWAACGIPTPQPLHAHRMCAFALQMQIETERLRRTPDLVDLHIRVGIDTGVVGGGIFGHQQFTYQVFGDTNERAELMEQLGPVDGVLISAATLEELNSTQPLLPAGTPSATVSTDPAPTANSFVLLSSPWDPAMDDSASRFLVEENIAAGRMLYLVEGSDHSGLADTTVLQLREDLAKPKYTCVPLLQFADSAVEQQYWEYADTDFGLTYPGFAFQSATFFIVLTALLLAEGPYAGEWYVATGFVILAAIDLGSVLLYTKMPPLLAYMRFPVEFIIARFLCISINYRYSMLSIHIHFLLFFAGLSIV